MRGKVPDHFAAAVNDPTSQIDSLYFLRQSFLRLSYVYCI